jgi:hypothetical protein
MQILKKVNDTFLLLFYVSAVTLGFLIVMF